jgi:parvulin-like peptidyl-prolyl isomerase
MWGEAATRKVVIDSAQLERNMQRLRSQYEDERAFRQAVQKRGLTVDSVRAQQATKLRAEQLWETMAGRATPPSDSAIRAFRQAQRQDKVQFRHILFPLPPEASDAEVDSVTNRARAVLDSIQGGASFATMARRHSAAASASLGGRRRAVPTERLKAPVAEALASLRRPDALAEAPVVTERGVHLLQLVRRNENAGMSRGEAKWALLSKRRQSAVDEALRSLKSDVVVHVNPSLVSTGWAKETP